MLTRAELLEDFSAGFRPRPRRVGLEYELLPLDPDSGRQIPYSGTDRSVESVLRWLATHRGWQVPKPGPLLALERDGASITLEPGAQIELSGKPHATVREAQVELDRYLDDLRAAGSEFEIAFVPLGITPVSRPEQIVVIPKARYAIMTPYLATRGSEAWWMMRCTAGMQVNLDANSPAAAAEMLQLVLRLAPVLGALFANSPICLGVPNGWRSRREAVWTAVDDDRCGYPARALERGYALSDYVDWALEARMFFIERDGELIDLSGTPFREFLERGAKGYQAQLADWRLHLSTLFPEARLKSYVEIRCADSNQPALVLAFAAITTALIYAGPALREEMLGIVGSAPAARHRCFHLSAARLGLEALSPEGKTAREQGLALLAIARRSLGEISPGDLPYLDPLELLLERGESPADSVLRDGWKGV